MKKRIEELQKEKFTYEQPRLLFSQERISLTMKAGETRRGEIYVGTEENIRLRGYVTSSSRRLVPAMDRFSGTTVRLAYGVDTVGLEPGDEIKGWLCVTTSIGECRIPFEIRTQKEEVQSFQGTVNTLDEFCQIARRDFREAYRIFTDRHFCQMLKGEGEKERAFYKGMSAQPVTYQHLEEFLIALGRKEPVTLTLKEESAAFYKVDQSRQETFRIQRSGWGHLRLEIDVRGAFLEVAKRVVTDEDFIGSTYEAAYLIRREHLGSGSCFGEIVIKSPYQELVYPVTASRSPKMDVNVRIMEKKQKLSLLRDYLDFLSGRMDFATWSASSHFILNQLKEAGCSYPEYQMYEAYLLHREGSDEEAVSILEGYQDKTYTKDDLEFAGLYLYLCSLTGLYTDKEQTLRRIRNFYMQKEDSAILLWLLLRLDPELEGFPSKALFMMEEIYEKGCKSPFLYLEAWERICKDMSLLHRMNGFWAQVFLFAARKGLLTQELSMRLAYLSGYEKRFNKSLYRALAGSYQAWPSDDTLEAVCKYVMKGDPAKKEYFPWFSLAVEKGLRLTRLYEYYVETMDTGSLRELPKSLLMYFAYNNDNLSSAKKAFIYHCVTANKERSPGDYESYEEAMEAFAKKKLAQGCMNENYAALYQEFLREPKNRQEAQAIGRMMFTCRLYCDDKKMRSVVVRHGQMAEEEVYPLVQGVAYPRIYTEDAVILFQDEMQRRYGKTVRYSVKKMMEEGALTQRVLSCGGREPGVLLHYCENVELTEENLELFQKLAQESAYSEEYRILVRKRILDYFRDHAHAEGLDGCLKKLDFRAYALVDKRTLLEVLIARGLFPQALSIVEEFGAEGLETSSLLKLTSRMLTRCEMEEDEELLALASQVYRTGLYDEVILTYLMQYRYGPVDELFSILKSAKGFGLDTYQMEEKLICLLMFAHDYRKEGENVLADYRRHGGKEEVIRAYLIQISYGIFVREFTMSAFVKKCLQEVYEEGQMPFICALAYFKEISRDKRQKESILRAQKALLKECVERNMVFAFFRRLSPRLLGSYQLDDKICVEHHASPDARVTLFYALDTGLGMEAEYKSEPLRDVYEGIFTKTFTLFYGETLRYYFQTELDGKIKKTAERVLTMTKVEGTPVSKYQMLNQILSARRLGKEKEVMSGMRKYLRQEQYVKEMFVIRKED
ncbi:MAG: DUF5717 family protein [Eubacteriales bacterium]|nr:DUF5717 family protein [Eubacteriales bacterium]